MIDFQQSYGCSKLLEQTQIVLYVPKDMIIRRGSVIIFVIKVLINTLRHMTYQNLIRSLYTNLIQTR